MLGNKIEKVVFAVILFAIFTVIGYFGTEYKLLNLPINKGLSPEKVIEEEFDDILIENQSYKYLIREEFLFTGIQINKSYWQLEIAVKNENSGYIFDVPGILVGQDFILKTKLLHNTSLGDDRTISVGVVNFNNSYVVIVDKWDDQRDFEVYANGERLESLTQDLLNNDYWFYVIKDLSEETQINCIFKDKEYHIVNNEEIRALYKEAE